MSLFSYYFVIAGQNFSTSLHIGYRVPHVSSNYSDLYALQCVGMSITEFLMMYSFCRNYWRDPDTALFMLKYLYRDIPEEPESPNEQRERSSKHESRRSQWLDPREIEDEELPLTFADNMSIKNFSYKAKTILKSR